MDPEGVVSADRPHCGHDLGVGGQTWRGNGFWAVPFLAEGVLFPQGLQPTGGVYSEPPQLEESPLPIIPEMEARSREPADHRLAPQPVGHDPPGELRARAAVLALQLAGADVAGHPRRRPRFQGRGQVVRGDFEAHDVPCWADAV